MVLSTHDGRKSLDTSSVEGDDEGRRGGSSGGGEEIRVVGGNELEKERRRGQTRLDRFSSRAKELNVPFRR